MDTNSTIMSTSSTLPSPTASAMNPATKSDTDQPLPLSHLSVAPSAADGEEQEKDEEEEEAEEEEDDDMETFTGKIVYNPDGSAYIIEGSEISDVESELGGTILKEGGIIDDGGHSTRVTLQSGNSSSLHLSSATSVQSPSSAAATVGGSGHCTLGGESSGITVPIPKVVAAHHISRYDQGASLGSESFGTRVPGNRTSSASAVNAQLSSAVLSSNNHGRNNNLQSKVPDVPIMHSYRVYTLRDGGSKSPPKMAASSDHSSTSTNNPTTTSEETATTGAAGEEEDGGNGDSVPASIGTSISSVPVKPILMCFICKISFGYTKSFVSHATTEHHLDLVEEESRLLAHKNVSAIIQGVGKDKEPLLSFLEPKNQTPLRRSSSSNAPPSNLTDSNLITSPLRHMSPPVPNVTSSPKATTTSPNSTPAISAPSVPELVPVPAAASSGNNKNPGDLHQQFQQQLMAMQVAALAAMRSSQGHGGVGGNVGGQSSSVSSSCSSSASSSQAQHFLNSLSGLATQSSASGGSVTTLENITKDSSNNNNQSRPSSNGSLNLVMPKNNNNSDGGDGDKESDPCSELADLANLEKIAKAAAAAIQSQQEFEQFSASQVTSFPAPSPPSSQSPNSISNSMSLMAMVTSSPKGSTGQHPSQYQPGQQQPGMPDSHMTMMHSRNSCKTLKCPKCNWHYKYQETLEIHMKEKHPENEMNCIYCLTNQAHPRLARGETYTCGYKPYRCEVCNYSTTTKGNLSIHMQSDKHINNVQELQNGGTIPGQMTGSLPGSQSAEHMLQSQALATAVALAAGGGAGASSVVGSNNVSGTGSKQVVTNVTGPQNVSSSSFGPSGSNASSPGLNLMIGSQPSGDKVSPINTVPMGGVCPSPSNPNNSTPNNNSNVNSSSSSSAKPKATWRCDVCNYETGVARNLRIHMTSEKHTHNMVVLQQSVKHYQVMQQQAGLMAAMSAGGGDPMLAAAAAAQMHPGILAALAAAAAASSSGSPVPSLPSPNEPSSNVGNNMNTPEAAIADMAYNHAVLLMQQQQQRAMAMMSQSQSQSKSPFGNQSQNQPMVDMEHPDPSFRFDSVPYDEHSRSYQCCVCTVYTCDSIEGLSQHIQSDRTRIREDEVTMSVGGNGGNVSVCKMCSYKTNLKANFQLHCKTDKHLQRLQQVNHIKEGGARSEWKLKYVNVSNPIQVRCNLCDYYTNSIHKLQLHASNPRHETSARVFVHLQLSETILRSSQRDNGRDKNYYYNCSLCNFAARTKVGLVHHVNSMKHSANEIQRQQQRNMSGGQIQKSLEEEIREVIQVKELLPGDNINFGDSELNNSQQHNDHSSSSPPSSAFPSSRRSPSTANAAANSPHGSIEDLSMASQSQPSGHGGSSPHSRPSSTMGAAAVSMSGMDPMLAAALNFENSFLKHALQEQERQQNIQNSPRSQFDTRDLGHSSSSGTQCPFCNYSCSSDVKMQLHVLTQHANKQESRRAEVKRLLCPLCQEGFEERIRLETHLMDVHNVTKEGVERLLTIVDTSSDLGPESKKRKMGDDETNAEDRSDTSSTDGRDESIEQTAARFLKLGGGVPLAAVSDRHVYKYRCQQCSLAFKTKEKLQLHSQYHLIRAATQCVLCNRSFRSVEALQRHVETSHRDMTDNEVECYRASLANNPFLGRNGTGILDPSTTELLLKESNRGSDIDGNDEDAAMDLAMSSLEQSIAEDREDAMNTNEGEGGHNSLEDYLNSQAMAEDSYNDPSRKYKCHRCKVAFTRQSYLTAHNKTLLHRKGEKVDYPMEKYLDPNRPFKCEICKESFTQKNILLVHYNSVSHLHRSKQLKMKEGNLGGSNDRGSIAAADRNLNESGSALLQSLSAGSGVSPSNESGNNLLFPPSDNSSASDEKKPFKCNICKVSYNLSSSLDIHIRSVLHQSRASKINELILMGQIDLSVPFIERGEESTDVRKSDMTKVSTAKEQSSPAPSPFGMNELQLQQQLQQQLALAAMAQAASQGSLPVGSSGSGVFPCGRCGSLFPSQEICMQHSQLCSLFGPPMMNETVSRMVPPSTANMAGAAVGSSKFYSAPTHRTKPPIYKHLLETFGFEIVMQFNEHHQRRKRIKTVDNPENVVTDQNNPANVEGMVVEVESTNKDMETGTDGGDNESVPISTETKSDDNIAMDMSTIDSGKKMETKNCPEINRSVCSVCSKEFSSVWVLKAHKEEVHKQVVPFSFVESFAEEYRKEFENKQRSQPEVAESPEVSNEQPSVRNNRPTPSQTPGDVPAPGHSTPIPTQSGNLNNPSPPQSGPSPNPNAQEGGMNPAAAQLAAQMQFSQLLMSMGLAGMAVPGMVNNPFAAAAAMGIPPQMIPLMMASGHLDPMMAAFNHQAAAAAAQGLPPGSSPVPVQGGPSPSPMADPMTSFANQQKILQQQQMAAAAAAQQGKRARTRITDEQLKILRQYFDINNSPSEEALAEMSEKSGLPLKVIKHWFRNTLFKERQRNKDSPYNFNNPPSTFLNLEEYEKTGEAKMIPIDDNAPLAPNLASSSAPSAAQSSMPKVAPVPTSNELKVNHVNSIDLDTNVSKRETVTPKMSAAVRAPSGHRVKTEEMSSSDDDNANRMSVNRTPSDTQIPPSQESVHGGSAPSGQQQPSGQSSAPSSIRESFDYAKSFSMSPHSESSMSSISTNDTASQNGGPDGGHHHQNRLTAQAASQAQMFAGLPAFAAAAGLPSSLGGPLAMAIDAAQRSQSVNSSQGGNSQSTPQSNRGNNNNDPHGSSPGSNSGPGKRANRTRFTDYQIKVLQEFFESNAYPKDDDLEYLSKLLNLSPRVIVVWFQNARQKARKVYENQPAAPEDETSQGRFQRTPGLNYQCKKCQQVFQRYYELIKHQKSACFKDENPLSAHLRAAAERRDAGSTSPGAVSASNMSNHSSNTPTPDKAASPSANAFRCEKCSLVFPRFDLWREHQLVHLMNPSLFPNAYPPSSPFGILQFEAGNQQATSTPRSISDGVLASIMSQANNSAIAPITPPSSQKNRSKVNNVPSLPTLSLPPPPVSADDEDSLESFSGQGSQTGSVTDRNNAEAQRDKRLRTTILPEQLDYLYQKYQLESNPSRKMLENIAKEVGLKKRVVQVWFQNTRARERKGQFRAHQQVIHKRCPFCRALFKARSALESHLATRHADQYTKGDINIDALPDGEPDDLPQTPMFNMMMAASGNNSTDDKTDLQNEIQAKQWKKYMEEFAAAVPNVTEGGIPPELALTMRAALGGRLPGESTPLDLSKPVDLTRSFGNFGPFDGNGYDSHSDADESGQSDLEDENDGGLDSPTGPGSANSSITGASPAAIGAHGPRNSTSSNSNNNNNKRFRTQMTTVQLKVMKSIFADYKTPSMAECDSLGRDIGLPKRVIQVWFQNARAKEKKARLNFAKSFGHEMPDTPRSVEGCKVCSVRYNADVSSTAMQDHLFSKAHLDNLRSHIDSTKKTGTGNESADESVDYPAASMIVMPNNHGTGGGSGPPSGDEAPDGQAIPSQSVNNLMQLMGLAFQASATGEESGMNPVNGGSARTGFMAANNFMANHQQFKQPNL